MTRDRATPPADRVDDQYCERCGSPAGPVANLSRMGLTTCRACGIHACQRCWARSVGWCPACGVSMVATPLVRSLPTDLGRAAGIVDAASPAPNLGMDGRRSDRGRLTAFAAAGTALVLAATAFLFVFGAPFGPSSGVAAATGTPGPSGLAVAGFASPDAIESNPSGPRPTRIGAGTTPGSRSTPVPGRGAVTPPRNATPKPGATPRTPTRTTAPTPRPTPRPTPHSTPAPTPCFATAPNLVGQRRGKANQLWSGAGFTGAVTALDGHGNYVIASQDRTPGASYPCSSGVTIGP